MEQPAIHLPLEPVIRTLPETGFSVDWSAAFVDRARVAVNCFFLSISASATAFWLVQMMKRRILWWRDRSFTMAFAMQMVGAKRLTR